jgi:hypothetical protein
MAEKLSQWRLATESTCVGDSMKAEFGTVYDMKCVFRLGTSVIAEIRLFAAHRDDLSVQIRC